jgi:hypothetical protein
MARASAGIDDAKALGVRIVGADAFDYDAVRQALVDSTAEVVIDPLTALPGWPADPAGCSPSCGGSRPLWAAWGGTLPILAADRIRAGLSCFLKNFRSNTGRSPSNPIASSYRAGTVGKPGAPNPGASMDTRKRIWSSAFADTVRRYRAPRSIDTALSSRIDRHIPEGREIVDTDLSDAHCQAS